MKKHDMHRKRQTITLFHNRQLLDTSAFILALLFCDFVRQEVYTKAQMNAAGVCTGYGSVPTVRLQTMRNKPARPLTKAKLCRDHLLSCCVFALRKRVEDRLDMLRCLLLCIYNSWIDCACLRVRVVDWPSFSRAQQIQTVLDRLKIQRRNFSDL